MTIKHFIVAAGVMGACAFGASALAQSSAKPSEAQATQALQNAMQRELQGMQSGGGSANVDMQTASSVVRSLQVKSVDNCQPASPGVACDVKTSAEVRGSTHEDVNKYLFYQQAGKWEARLPS